VVGLGLIFGQHHEADRLISPEVGAAIQAYERATEHGERDSEFCALEVRRRVHGGPDTAVREGVGIELRGLAGLAVVEPQAGRQLLARHR
jgi:hypothetical protein